MRNYAMRNIRIISLVTTAAVALLAQPVMAEEEVAASDSVAEEGEIIVYGQGETRQVQEVKAEDVRVLLPGTSVIRALEKLPSVNIQAADPFGNYEWSKIGRTSCREKVCQYG